MFIVLVSWIYILAVCLAAGCALFAFLERVLPLSHQHSLAGIATAGVVVLTVYAEYYSLFDGIGVICHLLMWVLLLLALAISPRTRAMLREKIALMWQLVSRSYTGVFIIVLVIGVAFFTSRGNFHTDTGIYHAAAIRWNEEYGVVKGLANLDLHYGYNSSYLVFCSLFTFSWVPGIGTLSGSMVSLHTTTGFLAALYLSYACRRLRHIMQHERHLADAARIVVLMYFFTNATGMMSPATDYGTMLISAYIACAWLDIYEHHAMRLQSVQQLLCPQGKQSLNDADASTAGTASVKSCADDSHIYEYGLLSMLALFTVSMKLSSAAMFILVLYPLVRLIKAGQWRQILYYVLMGVILFVPFLIRNVILTGWLFYPVLSLDLFNVAWKVPYEYAKVDADQIKVWGRCLYDITKVDLPITEWIGTWWEGQSDYGQMLLYGVVLSPFLFLIDGRLMKGRGERAGADLAAIIGAMYFSAGLWFLTAPFIRYGLTFLLLLALLPAFSFLDYAFKENTRTGWKVPGMFLAGMILTCGSAWIAHYAKDDLSFVKQHLLEPYYLMQQPFDQREEETVTITNADGTASLDVYAAGSDEVNSYYQFPGTCYSFMTERSQLLGDTIADGFGAK